MEVVLLGGGMSLISVEYETTIFLSGQLPTLTCCQFTVVELGEGQVGSCPDIDIDPFF